MMKKDKQSQKSSKTTNFEKDYDSIFTNRSLTQQWNKPGDQIVKFSLYTKSHTSSSSHTTVITNE